MISTIVSLIIVAVAIAVIAVGGVKASNRFGRNRRTG
jgi:hypothetical protein